MAIKIRVNNSRLLSWQLILLIISVFYGVKLFAILLTGYDFSAPIPINANGAPIGQDYAVFYAASKMLGLNMLPEIYNASALQKFIMAEFSANIYASWGYSPVYFIFIYPLAGLSYLQSFIAFTLISAAALVLVLRKSLPVHLILLAIILPAVLYCFMFGQNAILFAALISFAFTQIKANKVIAAIIFAILVLCKPQLCLLLPIYLIVKKEWVVIFYTAIAGAALVALSIVLFGLQAWQLYFGSAILQHGSAMMLGNAVPTVHSLLHYIFTNPLALYALFVPFCAVVFFVVVRFWQANNSRFDLLIYALATFAISPYYLVYDMAFLMLALIYALHTNDDAKDNWANNLLCAVVTLLPIAGAEAMSLLNSNSHLAQQSPGLIGFLMGGAMLGSMLLANKLASKISLRL